ncbi:Uncharacterised protein [Candidatus Gugararchaeum adminiculabundum]|nr:Uncharacterised protein [Candidatus Gugararchaeum adminiculabundum]
MMKNTKILFGLLVALMLLFGCTGGAGEQPAAGTGNNTVAPVKNDTVAPEPTALEKRIAEDLAVAEKLKTRPDYGFGITGASVLFQKLPAFPTDFYKMRVQVRYNRITDLTNLDAKYYKQPEFYPGFDDGFQAAGQGAKLYAAPPEGRWGAFGYGTYPADAQVTTAAGQEFKLTTFFHTGWLVESYQGTRLTASYPETASLPNQEMTGANSMVQDPVKTAGYFDVTVTPNVFLLDPAFPQFGENWAQKVIVDVKVKEGTPKGVYVIGINPSAPPAEQNDAWATQYTTAYTTAGAATSLDRPFYQIAVDVK